MRFYLLVSRDIVPQIIERLDPLRGGSAEHYTAPILPINPPDYPFVLLPIDSRAESLLSADEWASRLESRPPEFSLPVPQ